MGGAARGASGAVVALIGLALTACTANQVDPERADTVVMAVDAPFASLNAGLPEGRTPGSTLVRGLVTDGFVGLDESGGAVFDAAFGTVEKLSDEPLTVRYTVADGARWSDGVPVTPADLLLEWAARSGRFDEVAPGEPPTGPRTAPRPDPTHAPETPIATVPAAPATTTPAVPSPGGGGPSASTTPADPETAEPTPVPEPSPPEPSDLVSFGAPSAALAAVVALPTIEGSALTLVYTHPVADWQVALDVGLPAHVVGRVALGGEAMAPALGAGAAWADDVTRAITEGDRTSLARIATVWRTGFDAAALAADPSRAVTTGPYRIGSVDAGRRVTLVPNAEYRGSRPADRARIVVRWDLGPLDAVEALRSGDVDIAAPVSTPDVTTALTRVPAALIHTGGGAVFQLVLNEAAGTFAVARPSQSAAVSTLRATFVASVPRDQLAREVGGQPSSAVLATLGAGAVTDPPVATGGAGDVAGPVPVRVLVATGDPVRAAMLDELTTAASAAGFAVSAARPRNPDTALWTEPGSWDAALVPVPQAELPVAATVDRWRTGGSTNVSGHADGALDRLLDALGRTVDPPAAAAALAQVGASVRDARAVVPLVRQPSVIATVQRAAGSPYPRLGDISPVPWGDVDLAPWWSWAVMGTGG